MTTESGSAATFTVVLTTQPTSDVSIALSSSDPTEGTVSPTPLTFTSADWNTAQTVTVTGVDDSLVDGNIAYTVNFVVSSSDGSYNNFSVPPVSVTNNDNDTAGVTLDPATLQLNNGQQATYKIYLNTPPTGSVTVLFSFDPKHVKVDGETKPFTLTFSDGLPKTLTVFVLSNASAGNTLIHHSITSSDAP